MSLQLDSNSCGVNSFIFIFYFLFCEMLTYIIFLEGTRDQQMATEWGN